jgi:signal transduction histidine kinase
MIVTMAVLTTMVMPPMLRGALARLPMRQEEKERLAREERETHGFLANVERVLLVADDSGNGRFAAHLTGLVVGSRRMPTTVLPIADDRPSAEVGTHTTELETFLRAASAAAAEVEDERGVPVEVVMVGDCDTSDSVQALVRAAREAMVNAAKHSGADKIDVYAEVNEETVEVFVRDRGQGFDADDVAEDRLGVKRSIIDRMARHGGTATVRSRPGDGTEVRLEIKR